MHSIQFIQRLTHIRGNMAASGVAVTLWCFGMDLTQLAGGRPCMLPFAAFGSCHCRGGGPFHSFHFI